MQSEKSVSFREFARLTGTSDGAVRKAVKRGSIVRGLVVDGDKTTVIPSIASEEWGKALIDHTPAVDPVSEFPPIEFADGTIIQVNSDLDREPVTITYANTNPETPGDEAGEEDTDDDKAAVKAFMKSIPQGTSKIEAERLISVFKAQKAKRELEILEDKYVPKDLVFKNLFDFSAMMRDNFLNVPERIIDNVLAADTRNEAMIIMKTEISTVLLSLASIGDVKLSKNE